MPRRSHITDAEHFDMLPFIGLLMCVLGVLLFVTLSIAALAVGPNVKEGWLPVQENNRRKIPILVEWEGSTAVIHRGNQLERITVFSDSSGLPTTEMKTLVDEMYGKRPTHYVLFAVRPSGFKTFQQLADQFREKGIDVGYEPIPQDKQVRLLRGAQ
jgi:hypothetical protein